MDTGKPYIEKGEVRIFTQDIQEEELVWHRDMEDRVIDPVESTNWMFQYDNELPRKITRLLFIPKNTYHRIIKGTSDLKLRVIKL